MIYILFNQNNADRSHLKKAIATSYQCLVEGKAGATVYDKEDYYIGKPIWHLRVQNTERQILMRTPDQWSATGATGS